MNKYSIKFILERLITRPFLACLTSCQGQVYLPPGKFSVPPPGSLQSSLYLEVGLLCCSFCLLQYAVMCLNLNTLHPGRHSNNALCCHQMDWSAVRIDWWNPP